jgi:hypothetical protein
LELLKLGTSRKKALELMQTSLVTYQLILDGWQVGHQVGDGYDVIAVKNDHISKIELKAIDLSAIVKGKNATQHLSANELVNASHMIVSIFDRITLKRNFIMTIRQFVEYSGVKKYSQFTSFQDFIGVYKQLAANKSAKRKGDIKTARLDFDFSFNPKRIDHSRLSAFLDKWENLQLKKSDVGFPR